MRKVGKAEQMPDWWPSTRREMRKVKKGDVIRLFYGKGQRNNMKYHVRGKVDYWLVVRFWRTGCGGPGWDYKVLSPAWWSVFSKTPEFKLVRKRK